MPMPQTYFHASLDFDAFLLDVRDTCILQTHHQANHTLRAVLHTFRAYLTTAQALEFANILPAVTRAIFVEDWVEDWQPEETPPSFPNRNALTRKVKSVRQNHNMAPDSAISDVAKALRRSSVDERQLDRVLARLPEGAVDFWTPHS